MFQTAEKRPFKEKRKKRTLGPIGNAGAAAGDPNGAALPSWVELNLALHSSVAVAAQTRRIGKGNF